MLVDGRDRKRLDWASELDLGSVSGCQVRSSMSLGTLVDHGRGLNPEDGHPDARRLRTGSTTNSLLRHACDLLVKSAARPELVVDVLRRRGVVGEETAAAVGRCVGRRAACELVAEVLVGRTEVAALCDGLRSTGCVDVADCLAAVDALLQLTSLTDFAQTQRFNCASSQAPSSTLGNNCLPEYVSLYALPLSMQFYVFVLL